MNFNEKGSCTCPMLVNSYITDAINEFGPPSLNSFMAGNAK